MKDTWSRGDKLGLLGILLGLLGVIAAIVVVPEVRQVTGLDSASSSSETAARQVASSTQLGRGDTAVSTSTTPPEPAKPEPTEPNVEEARIASESPNFSPMTMQAYFDEWYGDSTTRLQQAALEERMLNKRVIWNGFVTSVEPGSDSSIRVVTKPRKGAVASAFLDFDNSQRAELLAVRPGHEIRFTCVIKGYVASPFLEDCRLLEAQ